MIRANSVTMKFGRVEAVSSLTLDVAPGEALALWGSNGAGKTTFLRCVLGLLRFQGELEVAGHDSRRAGKSVRRAIGYVPQELAFHDDMRLGAAVAFFARLRGVPLERAGMLLERVELAGHERKRVRELSGGMKQRLALAIALLADPPIVVLDEPTSNLDAVGRHDVVTMLRGLRGSGKTVLFASHRPDEVLALADRVAVMERGKLVRTARPTELWSSSAAIGTLRLLVEHHREEEALRCLGADGLSASRNGQGLLVIVGREEKARPIRVLERANIPVRDFELLDHVELEATR